MHIEAETSEHQPTADVHWIADEAIRSYCHKLSWRVKWGARSFPSEMNKLRHKSARDAPTKTRITPAMSDHRGSN